jgi:hypothetical protein
MRRASNGRSEHPFLGRHGTGISPMKTGRLTDAFSLLVLLLALALDTVPRFALGDSESYLSTQLHGYLPDDRSWAYGLAAGLIIRVSQDLNAVAIVQIAVSWVSAMLLGSALASHFRLGPWFRMGVLLVVFANPLSFYWTRAFMTDSLAAAAFGALVALLFAERGIVVTAAGVFILAVGICALRSVYLPPLLAAFGAVAALRLLCAARSWRRRDAAAVALRHAAGRYTVLAGTVLLSIIGYAALNAKVLHRHELSTNYATTRFLVSAWSPLMEQPLAALGLPATVTDHMTPLTYDNRLGAAFLDDGIVERLRGFYGSYEAAAPAYRSLLRGAVFDRPLDFLALTARSWSDYINPDRVLLYHREMRLTGATSFGNPDTLPATLIARLQGWGIWQHLDPNMPQVTSLGLRYFALAGGYWALLVALHATLAVPIYFALPRRKRHDGVLVILLFAFAYMAMIAMTTNELVTRYLMPLDIPLLVTLGALFGRRTSVVTAGQSATSYPLEVVP